MVTPRLVLTTLTCFNYTDFLPELSFFSVFHFLDLPPPIDLERVVINLLEIGAGHVDDIQTAILAEETKNILYCYK